MDLLTGCTDLQSTLMSSHAPTCMSFSLQFTHTMTLSSGELCTPSRDPAWYYSSQAIQIGSTQMRHT